MKRFFENKLNVILSIVLVAVIGLGVWAGFTFFGNPFDKSVTAIDFSTMNKTEVEKWISDNGLDNSVYNYSYQYDETVEKDYVVYQSVKEGDTITNSLTIVYSNGKDPNGTTDIANAIKNMSYEDIKQWFILNEYTNVTYVFETSDTYEFGQVISVNPSNATRNDAITVTLSYGKNIEDIETTVPDFSTYTKSEIEDWANEYSIVLKFNYESHDQAKEDEFLSQSVTKGTTIKGGSNLIITLSSGSGEGKTATIPDTLLGLAESEFISKLKTLGFTNLNKDSNTYYCETINKDFIYSYDDGTFNTSRTINYALSAGKYTFDSSEFVGKSKTDIEKLVSTLKQRNARVSGSLISVEFTSGEKNASKANTAYDCSISSNKISCKLYTSDDSTTALIPTDGRYLGVSENDFLTAVKKLGFTNFAKSNVTYYSATLGAGNVYSYDDGQIALNKTINYALCVGPYSFKASDWNGLSTEQATSNVNSLKDRNARINGTLISIKYTDGTSDSSKAGQLYDCSNSGATISCKVYTSGGSTSKKATIPDTLLGYSESNFLSKLKSLGFTNFAKSDITYYSETMGSGTVWSYDDGTFDTSTTINYALCIGKFTFNASDFNGLTTEALNSKVKDLKNRNAARGNLQVSLLAGETDSSQEGRVHDCSYSGTTISCYVYQGSSTKTVEVSNYVGADVGNFKTWCSNNGLNYSISEQYDSGKEKDRIISQSPSSGSVTVGSTIYVTVSKGAAPSSTGVIMSITNIQSWYNGNSFDEIKGKLESYLNGQGFFNLDFEAVNGDGYYVSGIMVGNTNHTVSASYDTSSTVTIYIAVLKN